ncbi:MAG: hypothetical protein LBS01_10905 [Prevotellaceae bacterium]|jgi:hypothetical protein|nr:hypothetical protein [Prevotellaceae bacterium]
MVIKNYAAVKNWQSGNKLGFCKCENHLSLPRLRTHKGKEKWQEIVREQNYLAKSLQKNID